MQDYDEALSYGPGHILAHLRKGIVLQSLKRPEVNAVVVSSESRRNIRPLLHDPLADTAGLRRFGTSTTSYCLTSCVAASVVAVQEARRCWKRIEELFRPEHDLLLLLEAQSLLSGVSPPPLGAAGVFLASPPSTETPAAATPEPSTAAAQPLSRPQVLLLLPSCLT